MAIFGRAFMLTTLIFVACFGGDTFCGRQFAEARTIMFQRSQRYRRTLPIYTTESHPLTTQRTRTTMSIQQQNPTQAEIIMVASTVPETTSIKGTLRTKHATQRLTNIAPSLLPFSLPSSSLATTIKTLSTISKAPLTANTVPQKPSASQAAHRHPSTNNKNDKSQSSQRKEQWQHANHQEHKQHQQQLHHNHQHHHQMAIENHQNVSQQQENNNRFYESYHPAAVYKPQIIEQFDKRDLDGQYEYRYVLSNGEVRYERANWILVGHTKVLARKGYYSFQMPNHYFRTVFYTADHLGFREDKSILSRLQPELPRALEMENKFEEKQQLAAESNPQNRPNQDMSNNMRNY